MHKDVFSWMELIVVANNHKLMNVWNPSIWGHHYSSRGHSFFFSWVNPFQICARAKWDLKNNGVSEDSTSVIESLVSERKKKCRRVGEGSGVWTKHEWDVKWKTGSLFLFFFQTTSWGFSETFSCKILWLLLSYMFPKIILSDDNKQNFSYFGVSFVRIRGHQICVACWY